MRLQMSKYILKLYVLGHSTKYEDTIKNLKQLCDKELRGQYEIKIVDLLENPHLAEDDKIVACPTLIKELPSPIKRVIGDLSDIEKILLGLDLQLVK